MNLCAGKMQKFERVQRLAADSLFFEWMQTRYFVSDPDYGCAVEYQVLTVSAVMQTVEKESVFVTRV